MNNIVRMIVLLSFVVVGSITAYACECLPVKEPFKKAKAVFIGRVVSITRSSDANMTVSIKFKVERYWKGVKNQYMTVLSSPSAPGSCGLPVEVGVQFLVYAYRWEKTQLETSICTSKRPEEAAELGKGKIFKNRSVNK